MLPLKGPFIRSSTPLSTPPTRLPSCTKDLLSSTPDLPTSLALSSLRSSLAQPLSSKVIQIYPFEESILHKPCHPASGLLLVTALSKIFSTTFSRIYQGNKKQQSPSSTRWRTGRLESPTATATTTTLRRRQGNLGWRVHTAIPRGGAAAIFGNGGREVVDLERAGLRLESLEEYTVIASILIGVVIDCYIDCPNRYQRRGNNDDHTSIGINNNHSISTKIERGAQYIHAISSTVSFFAGLFVVLAFSIFLRYAQSALGIGEDAAYAQLLKETGKVRFEGFKAFVLCLIGFLVSFTMNVYLTFSNDNEANYGRYSKYIYTTLFFVGSIWCLKEWFFVLAMASKHIFNSK